MTKVLSIPKGKNKGLHVTSPERRKITPVPAVLPKTAFHYPQRRD